jgi:hypothetical protein
MSTIDVVWPKSPGRHAAQRLAPRLASLDGARIGFVWDDMFRGDELFPVLAAELSRRYPAIEIVGYEHFGNIHGPDEKAVVGRLGDELRRRQVDAIICGNGC